ncbi:hypothetical protein A1O1_08124 [Capronia coronata CBS 617.96]|uniref:Uncharacterized protein n=1 Tax=Capronia coronata CBS 617.96 TaxID=1182541 RepID=W9XXG5_9EURO|nr:uncharacterized protein A1O1_08124 [Capronia coronata CBS 617.96]EXJ82055.1 hypothetical protein A1O1_08124 [Capronia coronata CBS 617.96]
MESTKVGKLHIDLPAESTKPKVLTKTKQKKEEEVIDSWEDDDDLSSLEDTETPTGGSDTVRKPLMSKDPALRPPPPPPTPISPENADQRIDWSPAQVLGGGRPQAYRPSSPLTGNDSDRERRRPEKTTATASRLIAAGLGIKPPKKTEEQRQYDRAVREQEIRRRTKEKEDQERQREAEEKAKAAVWDA